MYLLGLNLFYLWVVETIKVVNLLTEIKNINVLWFEETDGKVFATILIVDVV